MAQYPVRWSFSGHTAGPHPGHCRLLSNGHPQEFINEEMVAWRRAKKRWNPHVEFMFVVNRAPSRGGRLSNERVLLRVRADGDSPVHWRSHMRWLHGASFAAVLRGPVRQ